MRMAPWIALVCVGLTAPAARADHHGMHMEGGATGSTIGTGVSLVAASFSTTDFAGDYQGIIPSVSWATPRYVIGANLPYYRLEENGRESYGLGDAMIHGQATVIDGDEVHAGALLGAMFPTGDGQNGLGMGHPMLMPALWSAWSHDRVTLAASAGYSRALVDSMSHHDHGPWPLVEPMNMSEISWSASGTVTIAPGTRAGVRLTGGIPVLEAGHDRVVGALRVAWGAGRVDTAAEVQAGIAGDPFTIRGVVETALHF